VTILLGTTTVQESYPGFGLFMGLLFLAFGLTCVFGPEWLQERARKNYQNSRVPLPFRDFVDGPSYVSTVRAWGVLVILVGLLVITASISWLSQQLG
jgi:hypothetical protein